MRSSEAAELAALRRTDEDIAAIRAAMQHIAHAARRPPTVEEDVLFHRAIALSAGNPFMISTLDYLAQFLKGATRVTRANEARRTDFADAVTHQHTHISCAIEAATWWLHALLRRST